MAYISPILTAMANASKKASVSLLRDFNELEHLQNSLRNDGGFAMRSRLKAEKTLCEELAKIRSSYAIVTDEKNTIPATGNYFLLTAVDGYTNFAHGNGSFAISIAIVENNMPVQAIVYSPVYDELYFAEKGSGAFKEGYRNHERIRVSSQKNFETSLIGINAEQQILQKIMPQVKNVLITGTTSLDLAHTAAGKTDATISSQTTPAQIAAGILIVKEAGGYVYAIGEKDVRSENLQKVLFSGSVMATNEPLREKMAACLI